MAALVLRGEPLYEMAGAHLAALAEASNETANLGIAVDADRALYLRQVAGDHRVQTASWTGRTIPRHGTAMGAALAGELEPHGYAVSRGTLEADITAIAVPVRDYHDKIVAALSIIAPSYRTGEYDVDRYGLLLVEHAAALSSALGIGRPCWLEARAWSPSATMCSGSCSLSPYMKWLCMFSENRLASVDFLIASAVSRISYRAMPHSRRRCS